MALPPGPSLYVYLASPFVGEGDRVPTARGDVVGGSAVKAIERDIEPLSICPMPLLGLTAADII